MEIHRKLRPSSETSATTPASPSVAEPGVVAQQQPASGTRTETALAPDGFAGDGASTKNDAVKLQQKPARVDVGRGGGVLGFLLQKKSMPTVHVEPEIVAQAKSASMRALLEVRAQAAHSPIVEVQRADGSIVNGLLRGIDDHGHAILDAGLGGVHAIPLDEELRAVRHQMDTDGDLRIALVTVPLDPSDPWKLQGYVGEQLHIESYDGSAHGTAADADRRGDLIPHPAVLRGTTAKGLLLAGVVQKSVGNVTASDKTTSSQTWELERESWQIARVEILRPATTHDLEKTPLAHVAAQLLPQTEVEIDRVKRRTLAGTFLGMAKDSDGADYVVVRDKNGTAHAVRADDDGLVELRTKALRRDLWIDPSLG